MKNFVFKSLFLAALTVIALSGCKKEKEEEIDKDTAAAEDNALFEKTYNDAGDIADQAAISGSLTGYRVDDNSSALSNCATITHDTISNPHVLTIDFGTANCLGNDGRNRRGQIIVTYTGAYRDSGHVHTITFNNYYVNDYHVEGSKTVTNMGHNSSGNLYFTIQINGLLTSPTGQQRSWTSSRQREWIQGESTLSWGDDIYLITGSASGTSFAGRAFSVTILTPLRVELSCRYIVSGSFLLTIQNRPDRTLDYGNGACDAYATVTINNQTYNIVLH
jgi:hypothetical protein